MTDKMAISQEWRGYMNRIFGIGIQSFDPGRFGKGLNMSMIDDFFRCGLSGEDGCVLDVSFTDY